MKPSILFFYVISWFVWLLDSAGVLKCVDFLTFSCILMGYANRQRLKCNWHCLVESLRRNCGKSALFSYRPVQNERFLIYLNLLLRLPLNFTRGYNLWELNWLSLERTSSLLTESCSHKSCKTSYVRQKCPNSSETFQVFFPYFGNYLTKFCKFSLRKSWSIEIPPFTDAIYLWRHLRLRKHKMV